MDATEKLDFKDVLARFNQELIVAGYSKKTLEAYTANVRHFLDKTQKTPETVERSDIIAYLAFIKEEKHVSSATMALALSAIKFFFHNFLHQKIVDDIKAPKKAKKLPTVLTAEEVKALIKATHFGRDRCIVEFLYSSGVRVSECVHMKADDLDLKECMAQVKGGKGNKDRIIILSQVWIKDLKK